MSNPSVHSNLSQRGNGKNSRHRQIADWTGRYNSGRYGRKTVGRSYNFECGRCGYRSAVSGKLDQGVCFWVQTISCLDCKALYDSVTKLKVPDEPRLTSWRNVGGLLRLKGLAAYRHSSRAPSFHEAMSRLPLLGATACRWLQFRMQCPVSPAHRVEAWNEPGKCPKCGLFLEKGALPYRLWD
jgi:hypothetical protein